MDLFFNIASVRTVLEQMYALLAYLHTGLRCS
jgi:hypothetical protein